MKSLTPLLVKINFLSKVGAEERATRALPETKTYATLPRLNLEKGYGLGARRLQSQAQSTLHSPFGMDPVKFPTRVAATHDTTRGGGSTTTRRKSR